MKLANMFGSNPNVERLAGSIPVLGTNSIKTHFMGYVHGKLVGHIEDMLTSNSSCVEKLQDAKRNGLAAHLHPMEIELNETFFDIREN